MWRTAWWLAGYLPVLPVVIFFTLPVCLWEIAMETPPAQRWRLRRDQRRRAKLFPKGLG